jgi:hypothetical protein
MFMFWLPQAQTYPRIAAAGTAAVRGLTTIKTGTAPAGHHEPKYAGDREMRIRGAGHAVVCACALWACLSANPGALAADAERGRVLYEARCDLCHRTSVHVREARKATSFEELRRQVARWNAEIGGGAWSRDEIDDVTLYLNGRYYRFPCPESVCGGGQAKADLQPAAALVPKRP